MPADNEVPAADAAGPHAALFSEAAYVCADAATVASDETVDLLTTLGYGRGDETDLERANQIALLRAAARFTRVFQLHAPEAPGLVFLGGQVDPAMIGAQHAAHGLLSIGGMGSNMRDAFQSCIGEGVEYLSQFEDGTEHLIERDISDLLGASPPTVRSFLEALPLSKGNRIEVLRADSLSDQSSCFLPADICLRRSPSRANFSPPFKLSMGCAAGRTKSEATVHGICELIERDAAALWWRGGQRGRPIEEASEAFAEAQAFLAQLRGTCDVRKTWFLDITTDVGIPTVAALSCHIEGRGFAVGFSTRPKLQDALAGAIKELCQSELAMAVIAAKLIEGGPAQLTAQDRNHLARATDIDPEGTLMMWPWGAANHHEGALPDTPGTALNWITSRLHAVGISAYVIDLSRNQFSIPVVRVIAPGLQIAPSSLISPRLAAVRLSNRLHISDEPAVELF